MVGVLIAAVAGGALPFADTIPKLLVALAVLAAGHGMAAPSLSALTSTLAPENEVGGVMGVYQGISSLARIVGPFWAEWSYGTLGFTSPYLSAAAAYALALVVAVSAVRKKTG
jgi:MFS family permease